NIDNWVAAGMSAEAAENYLGAIGHSLSSPNMLLDLRIPQNQRYQQIVLDTALARLVAGEIDIDQTVTAIHDGWEEITEDLNRLEQLGAYHSALGIGG
ncbi:MAG: ABC transporter substrate-binding protein, partial [Pseudomonadota bacterium]